MLFSIITPSYNSGHFLEETLQSILAQRNDGVEVELIVVDGGSTDNSHAILDRYAGELQHLIVEKDKGPANAINKGLALASGDIVAWLNADDLYYPGALRRVQSTFAARSDLVLCFGRCPIIDKQGVEIRRFITRFKESFFPISSRFTLQCINYISQPAMFFRREALQQAGLLREDMVAAWDYEFILRLHRLGRGGVIPGGPVSAFRWHESSISGQQFTIQFQEELDAAVADAGRFSLQAVIHHGVRWGIIAAYRLMASRRNASSGRRSS